MDDIRRSTASQPCRWGVAVVLLAFAFVMPRTMRAQPAGVDTSAAVSLTPADTAQLRAFLPRVVAGLERVHQQADRLPMGMPLVTAEYASDDGWTQLEVSVADMMGRGEAFMNSIFQASGVDTTRLEERIAYRHTRSKGGVVMSGWSMPIRQRLVVSVVAMSRTGNDTTATTRPASDVDRLARAALQAVGPERMEGFIEAQGLLAGSALEAWTQRLSPDRK